MHVIVTGGAGFIGSNVTAAFLRDGHRVTVFDSLARPGSERNLGWVAHFMLAVAAGQPLTIYGNGKQVRDLLFVDDLVRAFKPAALHSERTAGNVYNMGGGPTNTVSVWQELRPRLEPGRANASSSPDLNTHPWNCHRISSTRCTCARATTPRFTARAARP